LSGGSFQLVYLIFFLGNLSVCACEYALLPETLDPAVGVATGRKVIKCRPPSARAQRYIRKLIGAIEHAPMEVGTE
jgi:hypothetical protein